MTFFILMVFHLLSPVNFPQRTWLTELIFNGKAEDELHRVSVRDLRGASHPGKQVWMRSGGYPKSHWTNK